jgi:hypothetical protein
MTKGVCDGTVAKRSADSVSWPPVTPSPGLVLLAVIRACGLWIEFAGEKISSRLGSSTEATLSLGSLRRRCGLTAITRILDAHRSCTTPPAFNRSAVTRVSHPMIAGVLATVIGHQSRAPVTPVFVTPGF